MQANLTYKILNAHLVSGRLIPGEDIALKIDQTLLQDATGTMALLEFEALGTKRVKAELAAQYVDHNLLQTDHKNADDHRFLQTACARYGIHFSRPGNGISHQVHMERFGVPGKTMIGADSHTPGAAGLSMLAMGAGGLDVALAMAGQPYHLPCPKVLGVKLTGALPDWVSARDVILEMLRRYDVKGCVGKVVEYYGPGVKQLSAEERLIIGNMGTELGATSTVFPSDENTRRYLQAVGRETQWVELAADPEAEYDEHTEIDLSSLEPLIAKPSSPGNVARVEDVAGMVVHQVIVGSSANSTFEALMVVAKLLEGKVIHPNVSFHINPASRQVMENLAAQGGLISLLRAGARMHQSGCLGCIGMGQAPGHGQVSLRTFPRNFPGRSGTQGDQVYLCSSETAVAAALKGRITDPRKLSKEIKYNRVRHPDKFLVNDTSIIFPAPEHQKTEIVRGPNIKPFPQLSALPDRLEAEVLIKVGDNISTDGIMPAGNQVLPLRSNIQAISEYVFAHIDADFAKKAKKIDNVIVIGGENYGQGSSREHAALAPRYLGVRAKIVKSFARIHKANLCNFGILPLTLQNPSDYDHIDSGAKLVFENIVQHIQQGDREIPVLVDGRQIITILDVSARQRDMLIHGGALNLAKAKLDL